MDVIIIEGPDNCGKDTLIQSIIEKYNTTTLIHCSKPKTNDPKEQDTLFYKYSENIANNIYKTELIIMNRGFHGEFVYGVLYRNREENDVKNMIWNCEDILLNMHDNIYYIQLMADNMEFLSRNEDNKSISEGNKELIEKECDQFKKIFNLSNIPNKKMIYVNDGLKFKSKETIFNEVMNFINNY